MSLFTRDLPKKLYLKNADIWYTQKLVFYLFLQQPLDEPVKTRNRRRKRNNKFKERNVTSNRKETVLFKRFAFNLLKVAFIQNTMSNAFLSERNERRHIHKSYHWHWDQISKVLYLKVSVTNDIPLLERKPSSIKRKKPQPNSRSTTTQQKKKTKTLNTQYSVPRKWQRNNQQK